MHQRTGPSGDLVLVATEESMISERYCNLKSTAGTTFFERVVGRDPKRVAQSVEPLVAQCARGYLADSADAEQAIFRAEMVSSLGILGR